MRQFEVLYGNIGEITENDRVVITPAHEKLFPTFFCCFMMFLTKKS
jgi:hypothetical protein